ncbi:MAG: type VI secretion system baseplate subunit TssG, partial [Pirellulaceae bacterium]|nr:type VI secretion system baseplate subunit TssG [Pirellulaceae bacterium]
IHLGPLSWSLFTDLHPQGQRIKKLAQFVKAYVGISIDFEFQLLLRADEVSPLSLGESSSGRLGWSSWLGVNKAGTIVDDSVFEVPLP